MKPKTTPKDFFLWFGAMLALYVSVFSFINLFFDYIDHTFPDQLANYVDPYSSSIRFAIASLVVLFPTFLLLMRIIRRDLTANPEKKELWVRRWALFLTIFIAGVTVAVDLITLINYYLGGDITVRFGLKVLIVLLIAGAGFLHFLADLKGFWDEHAAQSRSIAWAAGVTVAATIIAGFFIIGAPWNVRLYRFDDQKVSDLQSIQWQIVNYWQAKSSLPMTLADLNDPISNFVAPADPQSGVLYEYRVIDAKARSFELCATFNADTQENSPYMTVMAATPAGLRKAESLPLNDTWVHGTGHYCFSRSIDPERYPVTKK